MSSKKNFIHWYYTDGFRDFLKAFKEIIIFTPTFFSLALLTRTLLAPWHKDVSLKKWTGFNPVKSAQVVLWNLFSRVIGMIVRLFVIGFALIGIVAVAVIGLALFVVYFAAPGVLIGIVVLAFAGYYIASVMGALALAVIFFWAYANYARHGHIPYAKMDIIMLSKQKWFDRVWQRMGIDPSDVPTQTLGDITTFEAYLRSQDLLLEDANKIIAWEMERQIRREQESRPFSLENIKKMRPIGLHWHYGFTLLLNRFSRDLSRFDRSAYMQDPFFGHQSEIEMLELIMSRPQNNNALLLGEPGVGRKMLVHEFARRIRSGYYDGTPLMHARVLEADLAAAIADAQERGFDPEHTVENYFHEAAYAGNVVLFLENFEQYAESNRGFSYPTIIAKYASLPSFRIIGVSTEEAFHTSIESKEAMLSHFDLIHVEEMDQDTTMRALFAHFYFQDRAVYTFQGLREIVKDSERYTNTGPLPSRALSLATKVGLYWQKNSSSAFISPAVVREYIQKKTGIPIGEITEEEKDHLLSLEDHFHENIVGQDEAVKSVAEAVRRMRSGMMRPNHPAGSFLFLGPTGVGKTEMAKTLAREYFGDEDKIVRLDMSEFQSAQAVDLLMGSRALNQKGRLSALVQEHPYSILLLDEIEKASPRVLDLFLQILDEGVAHDGFGRKLSFTSMIIIATSNAGVKNLEKMVDSSVPMGEMKMQLIEKITDDGIFRPEFLNRFDDVVVFHPINEQQILTITGLLLRKFVDRTLEEQNLRVRFEEGVAQKIVELGFEPRFGARSVLRYIDEAVADALAQKIISGSLQRGDDIVFGVSDLRV